jgi:uncharacterized protein YqeY
MTLKERINADFMEAFKTKDMERKNFLGVLKSEIQNEEKRGSSSNDDVVLGILKKMEKSLIQTNTEESLKELEIIKPYLPKMMSESEIYDAVKTIFESGAENVGMVMKQFNEKYKGMADNKLVSKLAGDILKTV